MLFTSFNFAIFFTILFFIYWSFSKNLKLQNLILFAASYFFYAYWDWRFLFLLAFSTFLDYSTGLKIHQSENLISRKLWLALSVIINLSFLGFFKYYNFFTLSLSIAFHNIGIQTNTSILNIILPVGISFYTFHGLSYVFDIYRKKITPTTNYISYSIFVSFFPLLVAGPIERADHLLPQIKKPRVFMYSNAVDGLRQILWGLFKKLIIADGCAVYANVAFNNSSQYAGSSLLLGAIFFAFQIYGDFSGYTDIALGISRLLGFELIQNFKYPYFSRDIAEFWRRWHISLSSWFRDYLYIPLGGSAGSIKKTIRNVLIVFLLSGLWHGANWTFVMWGLLNALYIIPSVIFKTNRINLNVVAAGKIFPSPMECINILATFFLTVLAWIFFRANTVHQAVDIIKKIMSVTLFTIPDHSVYAGRFLLILSSFIIVEWFGRESKYAIQNITLIQNKAIRWSLYFFIIFVMLQNIQRNETPFMYFQF